MAREKRIVKKPLIYQAEDTPRVKRTKKEVTSTKKNSKENVNPEEEIVNRPEKGTSSVDEVEECTVQPVARNTSGKYEVEYSKTSRAKCRNCQKNIVKGDVRIGKMVPMEKGNRDAMGLGWWHLLCFFGPYDNATWEDFNGVEVLSVEDQRRLHLRACKCPMPGDLVEQVTSVLQAVQAESRQQEQEELVLRQDEATRKCQEEVARKQTIEGSTAEEVIRVELAKVIEKKTVDQLKAIIKENGIVLEETSTRKKGKKFKAPNKTDYQNAIVNVEPLCKIGSLVRRAIRKYIKVEELKILLDKAGLAGTGSKPELTKRLLASLEGDFGEESEEETGRKSCADYDLDDHYITNHGIYEKDKGDPNIVVAARNGNLNVVQEILKKTYRPIATVNTSRKCTEVEEKCGYDKSWSWHGETPLLASSRNGHYQIVHYLLTQEADPTLEGCISDDVHETPITAVNKQITTINSEISQIQTNSLPRHHGVFTKLKKYTIIKDLLEAAAPYWDRASYAQSSYSDSRQKSFSKEPNKAKNSQQLQSALEAVSLEIRIDTEQMSELAESVKKTREKES